MTMKTFMEIQELLDDLDFPAEKEQIVAHALERGAFASPAVRALRALPLSTYRNMSEVRSSVRLAPDETPD
jgi:hypothetical protein